ncbi:hypothetical protein SY88_02140 [Clostridiales bacterium PH28_bin88]|nr:hypothetical protein SY88_02140 [Clostridiales bacterium PH28_bin88]
MTYTEDNLIPISSLSQYYYCPRRAGLLLIEQQWSDNVHTAEGSIIHQHVHQGNRETRPDLVRLRGLPLHSLRLGLFGVADSIELYAAAGGFPVKGMEGLWETVPVEYKHGRVRDELEYEVQLCAQAVCLEEMLGCVVKRGFIYYAKDHRRKEVAFTPELRELVRRGAESLHEMLRTGVTPPVAKSRKCRECSLQEDCLPRAKTSAERYIKELWAAVEKGDES